MKQIHSPNFNARAENVKIEYVVLHYTGIKDTKSAIERMTDPAAKVSAHYFIDETGEIMQMVEEKERAWHAGISFWKNQIDMNSASIGIELSNPGHEFGYRPFTAPQLSSLKLLLEAIAKRHNMNRKRFLLAHSDIAPSRKQDPGELFPWEDFANHGFGVFPELNSNDFSDETDEAILAAIGYDVSNYEAALTAFKRRFYPESFSEPETRRRMISVRKQLS
ncbi:MAG: N-acetylmuramoyl-L-alanine amidase [Alphaproteobacteria bacterium]|nr:N-acetylmuramoyl-L-alanine amidase [Alphaproteobacteria bacterium]MCL2505394.1 N-acetylmuramoyl-L-alanine amidase [Alphaproteobacteria bacterium]